MFYSDSKTESLIDSIFNEFLFPGTISHFRINTKILYSGTPNAVAFANGTMAVTVGMIAYSRNYDMLAFVLAHEATHLNHRHGLRQYEKTKRQETGLIIGTTIPIVDLIVATGADAIIAGYSRDQEIQADTAAISTLHSAGLKPIESCNVINVFVRLSNFYDNPPSNFLASHPTYSSRIAALEGQIKCLPNIVFENKFEHYEPYDQLAAPFRTLLMKILLKEKKHEIASAFIKSYPDTGWENEAVIAQADIYLNTAKDSVAMVDSLENILASLAERNSSPDYHRIMGTAYYNRRMYQLAIIHLNRYLELAVRPKDRYYIEGLIERCENEI